MGKGVILNPKFVVDNQGKRVQVLLDVKEFDSLIEELEDLYDVIEAERVIESSEKRYSLEEIEKSLSNKK